MISTDVVTLLTNQTRWQFHSIRSAGSICCVVLSAWLEPVPNNPLKAYCRLCRMKLIARLTILRQHAKTSKHLQNEQLALQVTTSQQTAGSGLLSLLTDCLFVPYSSDRLCHLLSSQCLHLSVIKSFSCHSVSRCYHQHCWLLGLDSCSTLVVITN